jgi:EAL domain-containing protein (putative c-di-GMP-specific phosphodiesterase class I)
MIRRWLFFIFWASRSPCAQVAWSCVQNCAIDVTNAAVYRTAINLAHHFGSVAVAEGFETIADLQARS